MGSGYWVLAAKHPLPTTHHFHTNTHTFTREAYMYNTDGLRRGAGAISAVRVALLALVTPLLEKNPVKTLAADTALVFSMTRLIWLAFAITCLRQIGAAGIAGW